MPLNLKDLPPEEVAKEVAARMADAAMACTKCHRRDTTVPIGINTTENDVGVTTEIKIVSYCVVDKIEFETMFSKELME